MISKDELLVKIGIVKCVNDQSIAVFNDFAGELSGVPVLCEGDQRVLTGIIKKICRDHAEQKCLIDKAEEKVKGATERVL